MGKLRFNYRSQTLCQNVDITVVIPSSDFSFFDPAERTLSGVPNTPKKYIYKKGMKYQTVYMLHGGGDDDTILYRKTNVEWFADRNEVMLVTPNLPNSYFADTAYGVDYSWFLTEELPVVIQALFPSSPRREDNFIVGYAMGGNGALVTAIKRPDLYCWCVDMSGGVAFNTNLAEMMENARDNNWELYKHTFGPAESLPGSRFDMYAIAKKHMDEHAEVPVFRLYAGSDEGRIRDRVFCDSQNLKELGYDVEYKELPGYGHDWPLWNYLLEEVFDKDLPLKRAPIYADEL